MKNGKYSFLEELEHSYETATMKIVAKNSFSKLQDEHISQVFHHWYGTCLDEDDFTIFMPKFSWRQLHKGRRQLLK